MVQLEQKEISPPAEKLVRVSITAAPREEHEWRGWCATCNLRPVIKIEPIRKKPKIRPQPLEWRTRDELVQECGITRNKVDAVLSLASKGAVRRKTRRWKDDSGRKRKKAVYALADFRRSLAMYDRLRKLVS